MNQDSFLLDTHALIFWVNDISPGLSKFLDKKDTLQCLMISSISFWEMSFLVRKEKLQLEDIFAWKSQLFESTNIKLISPSIDELIYSTQLPLYHKDIFDRVLIAQANFHSAKLVTKDSTLNQYDVETFWIE